LKSVKQSSIGCRIRPNRMKVQLKVKLSLFTQWRHVGGREV